MKAIPAASRSALYLLTLSCALLLGCSDAVSPTVTEETAQVADTDTEALSPSLTSDVSISAEALVDDTTERGPDDAAPSASDAAPTPSPEEDVPRAVSDADMGDADMGDTETAAPQEEVTTESDTLEDVSPPSPDVPPESDALEDAEALSDSTPTEADAETSTPDAEAEEDGGSAPDADSEFAPPEEVLPSIAILSPASFSYVDEGAPVTILASVTPGDAALETLTWTLTSDLDGPIDGGFVGESVEFEIVVSTLSPGQHTLTLALATPSTPEAAEATLMLGICPVMVPDDFDVDIEAAGWKLYGNAYWDAEGWLELTGLGSGGGSIYKVSETLSAADTTIQFDFYTGGGINNGADGFAMTVIDLDDIAALEQYIDEAQNGGCLGYGISGACGTESVSAFHVEIDTFHNNNDPFSDPVWSNHIAVTLNGDPANHVLIADGLTLEDSLWHTILIEVSGEAVTVTYDGDVIIEGVIPGLNFRGGYIGFSGSTGWATNWHRVDNLTVVQDCQ